MRAPRDILKHVSIELAKGRRKCYRNQQHCIPKGAVCIVVQEGSFQGSKNYCVACSQEILRAAELKVSALRSNLSGI